MSQSDTFAKRIDQLASSSRVDRDSTPLIGAGKTAVTVENFGGTART